MPDALVVDDDTNALRALTQLVAHEGYTARGAEDLATARRSIAESMPDVVLCDLVLPDGHGIDLMDDVGGRPGTELILITGNATVDSAVEALRRGAFDYLTKPVDLARLRTLLNQLRRTSALKEEVSALRHQLRELGRFGSLVGTSQPMEKVYDLLERVAPTHAAVLLVGESGTGKELVAETIHRLSRRADGPFLPVNCGAVSPQLIESELFGHEKGSFTGADRQHQGFFERAQGGSLFLDEITEMSPELQVKLLRVLEDETLVRVGGSRPIPVDVRLITATNRDPEAAVQEGALRRDLYYRLKVFPIEIPPLRARAGDVRLLALHFLDRFNRDAGRELSIDPETVDVLAEYPWPGNVRELKNVIERAFILADDTIDPSCLPAELRGERKPLPGALQAPLGTPLDEVIRSHTMATLEHYDGDKRRTAEVLGISLKTLYNRLKQYRPDGAGTKGPDSAGEL